MTKPLSPRLLHAGLSGIASTLSNLLSSLLHPFSSPLFFAPGKKSRHPERSQRAEGPPHFSRSGTNPSQLKQHPSPKNRHPERAQRVEGPLYFVRSARNPSQLKQHPSPKDRHPERA